MRKRIILTSLLLIGCGGEHPLSPADSPQEAMTYDTVRAYLADQGIVIPERPLEIRGPSAKVAANPCEGLEGYVAIRGNVLCSWRGKFDKAVNAFDFFAFYDLAKEVLFVDRRTFLLNVKGEEDKVPYQIEADIDGDGDVDWWDFLAFADRLYGSKENPYGIGEVIVTEDPSPVLPKGDFDIQVEYLGSSFTDREKRIIQEAVDVWERAIVNDLEDWPDLEHDTSGWWRAEWDLRESIPGTIDVDVDDVFVYVGTSDTQTSWARGGMLLRPESYSDKWLPLVSIIALHPDHLDGNDDPLRRVVIHEIGHAIGFTRGVFSDDHGYGFGYLRGRDDKVNFVGANALREYRKAGGTGSGVPMVDNGGHWGPSLRGEIMAHHASRSFSVLSAITLGAMQDIGYEVNYDAAEPYLVPAGKPVAGHDHNF